MGNRVENLDVRVEYIFVQKLLNSSSMELHCILFFKKVCNRFLQKIPAERDV